ncbi:hypothetical protein GLOTRDRAFT_116917 [Gloeophyllum trabeum ATCC 11539]|uniref:Uncharacterized protein n=1 Tax=Gloeophyllum trabeum (strain ATCC 11539 / FP-39264 / Madison 617) TaxID=670483 RepID=S7RL97_GLOTA|nr:uncharacterized protein GLOTRDRAFT_116917 [Gloeophyllum trabeum ATCC 11539]EPQ53439.1 hypothetical protein GLOTRDRAFT_116917 [Gloeophyllum trabeum ATCC 11539]
MLTVAPSSPFHSPSSSAMDAAVSPFQSRPLRTVAGPKPLHLASPSTPISKYNSGPVTAPLTPISPAPKSARRQSSISYFSSNNVSEREQESPSLSRSRSVGVGQKGDRRSTGSLVQDRGPLTLVEKHADLLHFIAQKESKCLELRSALAKEEEELVALKRKWERIVHRGLQRASLPPSSPASPLAEGPASPALRRGHSLRESTSSTSTYATTATTSSGSNRLSQSSASSLGEVDEDNTVTLSYPSAKTLRRRSKEHPASPNTPNTPSTASNSKPKHSKRASVSLNAGALPPPSIPGIATLWAGSVGSVGKRWEEIQRGETFTKSQRRASTLLSDVFAALASPSSPASSFPPPASPVPPSPLPPSQLPSSVSRSTSGTSTSLLDDDGDGVGAGLGSVMTPDTKPAVKSVVSAGKKLEDEEEWNW